MVWPVVRSRGRCSARDRPIPAITASAMEFRCPHCSFRFSSSDAEPGCAAGAPRSEGGERGDLWHARINSRSGGGAAGAEPAQQQPRVEVTVRLDVRLPALSRKALEVPSLQSNFAYSLFQGKDMHQGVGWGERPAAEKISDADRFSKLHCGSA
jgi:hypothetical protein